MHKEAVLQWLKVAAEITPALLSVFAGCRMRYLSERRLRPTCRASDRYGMIRINKPSHIRFYIF